MKSLYLCLPSAGADSTVTWSQISGSLDLVDMTLAWQTNWKQAYIFPAKLKAWEKGSENLWALKWFCFLLRCYSLHLNSVSLVASKGNDPSHLENSVTWASKHPNLKAKIKICMLILETSELISSQNRSSYKKSEYLGKPLLRKCVDE